MRVVTLGNALASETLPSSQATLAFLRGERGAIWKVLGSALLRACLVAPGVAAAAYFAGARREKLAWTTATGSVIASTGISLFLLGHYWLQERSARLPATSVPVLPAGAEPTTATDLSADARVIENAADAGISA